jgi:hypothetical protein
MSIRTAALLFFPLALACAKANDEPPVTTQAAEKAAMTAPAAAPGSDEWKIQSALSAAPAELAQGASVMDWPAEGSKDMRQLKAGTNGWTCMPDVPSTDGPDPMCLDKTFLDWAGAWQGKTKPNVTKVGLAYMLQGDAGASLTDPYATGPETAKDWVKTHAHVMMIVPNTKDLEGLPANPAGGEAYVMWQGTPYAHIMMPVRQ